MLSIYPAVYLSIYLYCYLSIYLSWLSLLIYIYLNIYAPIYLLNNIYSYNLHSIYLPIYLSIYLSNKVWHWPRVNSLHFTTNILRDERFKWFQGIRRACGGSQACKNIGFKYYLQCVWWPFWLAAVGSNPGPTVGSPKKFLITQAGTICGTFVELKSRLEFFILFLFYVLRQIATKMPYFRIFVTKSYIFGFSWQKHSFGFLW